VVSFSHLNNGLKEDINERNIIYVSLDVDDNQYHDPGVELLILLLIPN